MRKPQETAAGPMVFPGIDGQRFRLWPDQQLPLLKNDDPVQPIPVADARVKIFDLSKPTDIREYEAVWDQAAKGEIIISSEEKQWCEGTQSWKVFLRWGEVYLEMPKGRGRMSHGQEIFS